MSGETAETVLPLAAERLRIRRRRRVTGGVRIAIATREEEQEVTDSVVQRRVEVRRVPVGRPVAEAPRIREEGDTLIIPVIEERLVVERRLVLREEVHLSVVAERRRETRRIALRRQEAAITRLPPDAPTEPPREDTAMSRTVTGLFDSRAEAERTVETLVQQLGLDRNRIAVHAAGPDNATAGTMDRRDESHHGFLAGLRDLFMPDEDRTAYAEGIRRGGILVAADVPEDRIQEAVDAFERHGVVDLDARAEAWRGAGWQAEAPMAPPAPAAGAAAGEEARIPLVEEQLRVGKRVAEGGGVRVRTYVVETPVEEQVTLREERVELERRPADRAAQSADFQDRTIEARETVEEAVVDKEARIREELVLRKSTEERTETVRDTVRGTEAEVEDARSRTKGRTPER